MKAPEEYIDEIKQSLKGDHWANGEYSVTEEQINTAALERYKWDIENGLALYDKRYFDLRARESDESN